MKRTPLVRKTPLRRTGRLRAMSPKRRAEAAQRRAVIAAVKLRDGDRCHAQVVISRRAEAAAVHGWPITCDGPLDAHEKIPRSAWPGGHLVTSNVIMVCRRHHDWIDAHEITAATLGLHGYSWQRSEALDAQAAQ